MFRYVVSALIVYVVFGSGLVAIAQEQHELPPHFPAAVPFVSAAKGRLFVQTQLVNSGEIVVVVSKKNIRTKASRHSGLPNERSVGDWSVRFALVPKLTDMEVNEIRKIAEQIPLDKAHVSKREALLKNVPDLTSSTHAYRIDPCPVFPTDQNDRKIVESFIQELSKELRNVDGTDIEKRLMDLLLQ